MAHLKTSVVIGTIKPLPYKAVATAIYVLGVNDQQQLWFTARAACDIGAHLLLRSTGNHELNCALNIRPKGATNMGVIATDDKDARNHRSLLSDLIGVACWLLALLSWAIVIYSR